MVYIPWHDYGICRFWMLGRCYEGDSCRWKHPAAGDRKRLWDEETRRQDEAAARGIPRPQPRSKKDKKMSDGASALDAPPSPKKSGEAPRTHKGVNSIQVGVNRNANLEELGNPNRFGYGVPGGNSMNLSEPTQRNPVITGNGLLSADVPGAAAVTMWKHTDWGADTPMINEEDLAQKQGGYWERLRERRAQQSKKEEEEVVKEKTEVPESRPTIPRQQTQGPHTSTLMPPPPPLPPYGTTPKKMGATKRLSNGEAKHVGPHPSTIRVSAQYISQNAVEKKLQPPNSQNQPDVQERSIAEAREDSMRLQGCTWIDNVRRVLQLPIRTYTTACVYYHKFRLAHPGVLNGMEYGNSWADACAASLLTSCKTEDTLKKSRDILAAAYNLKANTHDQVGSDDPMFDSPSRSVIGLERLVLESGGFDFRSKYPHKLLMKILKGMPGGVDGEKEKVAKIAWSCLTDLYRTFAPLKQAAATMALASLELAAHLVASSTPNNVSAIRDQLQQYDLTPFNITREEIMETLLDALDMYTQHTAHTILGTKYSLDDFLRIRLAFNKECNEKNLPRHTISQAPDRASNGNTLRVSNGHPTPVSPPQPGSGVPNSQQGNTQPTPENGGTQRFILNAQLAAEEKAEVQRYFVEEWEEYEEEIEVPITQPNANGPRPNPLAERGERPPPPRPGQGPGPKGGVDSDRERGSDRDSDRDRDRERPRYRERERDERDRGRDRPSFERRRYDDGYDDRGSGRRFDDRRERDRGYYEDDRRRRR